MLNLVQHSCLSQALLAPFSQRADDYLPKAFSPAELDRPMDALLRAVIIDLAMVASPQVVSHRLLHPDLHARDVCCIGQMAGSLAERCLVSTAE